MKAHGAIKHLEAWSLDAVTQHWTAHDTVVAMPTVGAEVQDHMVTRLDARHPTANFFNNTSPLMTQYRG